VTGYSRFLEEILALQREQRSSNLLAQPQLPPTTSNSDQQYGQAADTATDTAADSSWNMHASLWKLLIWRIDVLPAKPGINL
jgi:hypothetical protein